MENIDTLCSSLEPLVRNVLCAKIGICAREIELVQLSTGKPMMGKNRNIAVNDRFKLKIPISDQYATWEVVFNCSLPDSPPDFDLNDIDFLTSVTVDSMEELVPSLNDWDYRKPKALINVISELRSAYLKYQVEKLASIDNRCAYDYSTLIAGSKVSPGQIEVFIDNNMVYFIIKLDLDFTRLLPSDEASGEWEDPVVMLGLRYSALGQRAATLLCSPTVKHFFVNNLDLPHNIRSDEQLSEYAEEVVRSTEKQLTSLIQKRQDRRRLFMFELMKQLGQSLINCDVIKFYNASFMLEKNNFFCILEVTLPTVFPQEPPKYRLLSTYSTSQDRAFSQTLTGLPWNAAWDINIMVNQAISRIKEQRVQLFQSATITCFKPFK